MNDEIIHEVITDKNSDSESDSSWYDDESSNFDKIGMIIIQYEDIIDLENLRKIIYLSLSDNIYDNYKFKIINIYTKKYKDLNKNILNNLIIKILNYDLQGNSNEDSKVDFLKDESFENRKLSLDTLMNKYEKVIEDYGDVISEDSIILYFDILNKI